jgi:hypothetical protein
MSCDHGFISQNPGVLNLLTWMEEGSHAGEIVRAREILSQCPDCALLFYQDLVRHLRDFVGPRNPKMVLPWGMAMLGCGYGEIAELLQIPRETVRTHIFRTGLFLDKVTASFLEFEY